MRFGFYKSITEARYCKLKGELVQLKSEMKEFCTHSKEIEGNLLTEKNDEKIIRDPIVVKTKGTRS